MAAGLSLPGVYAIWCVPTGRMYVGSAKNIRARWRAHTTALLRGKGNVKLQRAWNKYGGSAFTFEILEAVPDASMLIEREQAHIDALRAASFGLNCRPRAASNMGLKMGPPSTETRAKISRAHKGKRKGLPGPMPRGGRHTVRAKDAMRAGRRARAARIEFGGQSLCLVEWAERIGISVRGLDNRLSRRWPLARALTEVSRGR